MSGLDAGASEALREAFTPTRPKQGLDPLFVGRRDILRRIVAAIEEERAHVVLFGDRGRGKTSVANAVERIAAQAGYFTIKLTCSAELGFEDMFRAMLARVPLSYRRGGAGSFGGDRTTGGFDRQLPAESFSATRLAEVLDEIGGTHLLLILDEYDRLTGPDVRTKLAELIKTLTDQDSPATLFIVGVAESLDALIGRHPSIHRAIVPVHLPPMRATEIDAILLAGAERAGVVFGGAVRAAAVRLACGLPYAAQLLGLHASRAAMARGDRTVTADDLGLAVERCLQQVDRRHVAAYHRALEAGEDGIGGPRRADMAGELLFRAACLDTDASGGFPTETLLADLSAGQDGARQAWETVLESLRRGEGALLEVVAGTDGASTRFATAAMPQLIVLKQAVARGLVPACTVDGDGAG